MTPEKATEKLFAAAKRGNLRAAELALDSDAEVNAKDPLQNGASPLHLAALSGSTKLVRLLIEKGADPYAKDDQGRTPLHLAESFGAADTATILKEAAKNRPGHFGRLNSQHRGDAAILEDVAQQMQEGPADSVQHGYLPKPPADGISQEDLEMLNSYPHGMTEERLRSMLATFDQQSEDPTHRPENASEDQQAHAGRVKKRRGRGKPQIGG